MNSTKLVIIPQFKAKFLNYTLSLFIKRCIRHIVLTALWFMQICNPTANLQKNYWPTAWRYSSNLF